MSDYIHIGKLVAAFGLTGELIVKHALGIKTGMKGVEVVFIEEQKGNYLPYFVTNSRAKTMDEFYLKLEGIDTRESAQRLVTRNIWLNESDFRKLAGKTSPISLLGYQLLDDGKLLGTIEEVIEQPHQILLRITIEGKEALIPLHQETLNEINHLQKTVDVSLPDGLLEVYL